MRSVFKKSLLLFLLCGFLLCGCDRQPQDVSSQDTESSAESSAPEESSASEEKEALVLLYNHYLCAAAERDGFTYRYTYCFDENGNVFNAEAEIIFPTEAEARAQYNKLLQADYPNLLLEGKTLSFAFPRKECPYYGISYTALPYLLAETIYTVTDAFLPDETEESSTDSRPFF